MIEVKIITEIIDQIVIECIVYLNKIVKFYGKSILIMLVLVVDIM